MNSEKINKLTQRVRKLEKRCCCGAVNPEEGCCYYEVTLSQAQTLVSNNELVPGALYKITGVHKNKVGERIEVLYDDGTNSGTTIYLQAITSNELSSEGWGEFYNPIYDQQDYGETDPDGAGFYLYNIWNGDGRDAGDAPTYVQGRKIIWGGYVWTNVAGNLGIDTDSFNLDSEWSKIEYNETDYDKVVDYIEYDFANDWICRRRQAEPVIDIIFPYQFWNDEDRAPVEVTHHGISAMQWGNKYNKTTNLGIGLMNINDSYCELINFRGAFVLGISMNNYSWLDGMDITKDSYIDGITLNNYSYVKNGYLELGSSIKGLVLTNYSYALNSQLTEGSYIHNLSAVNESYLHDIFMEGASFFKDITLENTSWLQCAEGSLLTNGGFIRNTTFKNTSYIGGVNLDNGYIDNCVFENEGYLGGGLIKDAAVIATRYSRATAFLDLENQNLQGSVFENCTALGYTGILNVASPQVNYRIFARGTLMQIELTLTFTGNAGEGAVGAITMPVIDFGEFWYIEKVIARSSGLTAGGGSNITLGIDTDAPTSGMDAVEGLVTTLNATPAVIYTNLGFEQATNNRKLVMAVGGAAVTAGQLALAVEMRRGL